MPKINLFFPMAKNIIRAKINLFFPMAKILYAQKIKLSLQKAKNKSIPIHSRLNSKQSHALKNWVEGLSDEAFYPWESPKKIRLKLVNPKFATDLKKVLIHR